MILPAYLAYLLLIYHHFPKTLPATAGTLINTYAVQRAATLPLGMEFMRAMSQPDIAEQA
ncbi:MAG: hypothetical protein A3F44_04665 [Candidatus Doudnabacteria bacterium RIFCSPHIGHO2_12_FULL_47_25]|nr:MAG: hypothetical protein A3F44_04665 [Candidatus Doudnabacteria bacterium RIFCSPHIGHO2_12_FULL_47_25]